MRAHGWKKWGALAVAAEFCLMAGMMSGCGPENESAGGNVEQPGELVSENTSGSEEQANHTGAEDSSERGKVSGEENAEAREYLVKELHYQEEQLAYTSEREYDAHDNLLRAVWYDAEGNISEAAEYVYDTNDNMVKMTWYEPDNRVYGWSEYEYDLNGNQVKIIEYDAEGEVSYWTESAYDTNGNRIRITDYYAGGHIHEKIEYEYDANGHLVREIRYDYDYDYTGELDSNGNLAINENNTKEKISWSEYEYISK